MGPIFCAFPYLGVTDLITFRCEAEMTTQTLLIVIKIGRENELILLKSAEDTEGRYKHTDFDVLRLCCENLYGSGG
jgi:hypothetical protein